jgi:hypothetical protein
MTRSEFAKMIWSVDTAVTDEVPNRIRALFGPAFAIQHCSPAPANCVREDVDVADSAATDVADAGLKGISSVTDDDIAVFS